MADTETRDKKRAKSRQPRRTDGAGRPGGKPTLRTIAEMTGLAITTISRALKCPAAISARKATAVMSHRFD